MNTLISSHEPSLVDCAKRAQRFTLSDDKYVYCFVFLSVQIHVSRDKGKQKTIIQQRHSTNYYYDIASGSDITRCINIDKPLVVYRLGLRYALTSIITLRIYGKILAFSFKSVMSK